ncbi:Growth hormone-regulated TBC protein 1 [Phytophthora pseudosyringae]|uniref:Growth hormone-regulated TBC protein 1 n=1 Tax=Phytophthora pseudosyringae TaxID=221518 RepID=A0A8T1WE66_9STRA|nr:Growth hormone-regulated TBC protein 1 [Phytophthora pseudosyringae]
MKSPSLTTDVGSEQHRVASSQMPLLAPRPELSIFPAFTPDPIRLAELKGSSTSSPPVSPTRGEARELFASIGSGQTFFELLEARGLTLDPTAEHSGVDEASDRIDAVHCVDGRRRTLLHQACRCGNVQVAKCLLFHGASASARCRDGRTPFHDAASSSTEKTALELLKFMFEHDPTGLSVVDANGSHVLHLAAIHGKLDVVQWLAGLLAQPSGKRSAVKSPRPATSRYLTHLGVASFSGRNMLHYAAYNDRLDVIKWLLGAENPRRGELSLGALDVNGYSVLHYAAMGASLEICEWLALEAPGRQQLTLTGRTSEGKTAAELASARPSSIRRFLTDISRVPSVPSALRCLGADTSSLGVGWDMEPTSNDSRLWETLKPLYFHLEICKKPASLSRASGFLTMLLLMPPTSPGSPRAPPTVSSALMSASYLLHWEPLGVLLQPEAREHWLCGLERDTEYLVRMRARNRNGFSGYSLPNLSGVFTTSDGGRRRSLSSLQRFFGAIKEEPPFEAIALSFIGDLHFELMEARGLPCGGPCSLLAMPMSPGLANKAQRAPQGRYYAVVSIETPSTPDVECTGNYCSPTRLIYCVRSPLATVQQNLHLSGSSQVWRHPRFSLSSVFRAPESLAHTQVTIAVHRETQGQSDSCCVGRLTLQLLDLVQGMPAKLQWLALTNVGDPEMDGGLVLLRTLFLPNGVSELPHPTLSNTWGTTAEELLSTSQALASGQGEECGSPPGSSSSTASTSSSSSSSCSSQFSHPSMVVDRLGFGVFDPEMQLRNGEWQRIMLPTGAARSYAYYRLLVEALELQQEKQWRNLRCSGHTAHDKQARQKCSVTGIRGALSETPVTNDLESCVFDAAQKRAVQELVWRGIPMSRRPELYSQMSGASVVQSRYPRDYFLGLIQRLEDPTDKVHSSPKSSRFSAAKKQIHVDLKRTFAGNEECWLTSPVGQQSLGRVLLAYALHNDALGYCQSMTFVVGRLLCLYHAEMPMESAHKVLEDAELPIEIEERVFWLLHVICDDLFPSYYTQGMTGLQVDGGVLEKLVQRRLPKMHRHFQQLHAPPMGLVLVTQWLLPLCCAVFPSETTFRFLDILFLEGSSVVFAMAIALLRVSQHEILAENVDYTQLFRFIRARDQRLHDAPLLMEVAYEEHQLLGGQVASLRDSVARELGIDQGERAAKSSSTTTRSTLPVDELRPGDVDISI